jgi:hypothetical protein
MAKKIFKITRIRRLRLHVWRGRLKRKAVKYDAEEIEFKKIKVAYGLIKDFKGNHIHF